MGKGKRSVAYTILGIDPGAHGALAFYDPDSGKLEIIDMPTRPTMRNGKSRLAVDPSMLAYIVSARSTGLHATVEKVGAMPGQGVASMFSFGRNVGLVEGVMHAFAVSVDYVAPRAWQRAAGIRSGAGKGASCMRAAELFPANAAQFSRRSDHGRADAALIAHYAARNV